MEGKCKQRCRANSLNTIHICITSTKVNHMNAKHQVCQSKKRPKKPRATLRQHSHSVRRSYTYMSNIRAHINSRHSVFGKGASVCSPNSYFNRICGFPSYFTLLIFIYIYFYVAPFIAHPRSYAEWRRKWNLNKTDDKEMAQKVAMCLIAFE